MRKTKKTGEDEDRAHEKVVDAIFGDGEIAFPANYESALEVTDEELDARGLLGTAEPLEDKFFDSILRPDDN